MGSVSKRGGRGSASFFQVLAFPWLPSADSNSVHFAYYFKRRCFREIVTPAFLQPGAESLIFKERKELIVEENRRNELDAKLKEMIKDLEQAMAKRKQPTTQSGTGNAIRRREGQEAKRFSIWNKRNVVIVHESVFSDTGCTQLGLVVTDKADLSHTESLSPASVIRFQQREWWPLLARTQNARICPERRPLGLAE
jgi:hypothetical protein